MKHYSKEQISILKTIANGSVNLSGHENDLAYMKQYRFLYQEGLIFLGYRTSIAGSPYLAEITAKGESFLSEKSKDDFRFWLPITISVIAIIVSIIALIVSVVL